MQLGKTGEDLACDALRRCGYAILERRYRTRNGEIDIIARDGATLVFVEVKARDSGRFGTPFDAVTPAKRRRLAGLAVEYVATRRLHDAPCRFDVVAVSEAAGVRKVDILRNAFDLDTR